VCRFAGQAAVRCCKDDREYYDTCDGSSHEERICEEVVTFGLGCEAMVNDTLVTGHLWAGHVRGGREEGLMLTGLGINLGG
jgi:hypothetical protein